MTEGLKRYIQWQFQWSDCTRGGFVDCSVTSPILTAGFEIFRSTGTSMTRPVGINATLSVNSSGAWLIDEPSVAIEANSQLDTLSFSERNPIVNVNNNIQPPSPSISRGGTIRNPHIDHRSPINANGDILMGIIVNAGTPSIEIVADYFDRNAGGEKGLIVMGDWREPSRLHGAAAVLSTGGNTYVRGVRIVGTAKGYPNILVNGEASRAVSCIADTIVGEAHNCLTNAQWIAGGGR